jgi:hypothetical protein
MTSRRLLVFSFFLFLLSLPSSVPLRAADNVKYFWTVDLDQAHALAPYHPVEPKLIGKARVCRVTYDKQGRIVLVEYMSAGKPAYDNSSGASKVKVEYQDGFERRTFLNTFGRLMTCNGGFTYERIKLDKEAHRGSMFFYDDAGDPTTDQSDVSRYQWELDDKGFITKEMPMNSDGARIANNDDVYEQRYKLNEKEQIVELRLLGKDGQLVGGSNGIAIRKYKWDNDRHIVEVQNFGPDELQMLKGSARTEIGWDKHDYQTEIKYYDAKGKLLQIDRNTIDENGNVIERAHFDSPDHPKAEGVAVESYQYDVANHITHYVSLDHDGKKINDDDSTAEQLFKYDDRENLLERTYKRADGTLGVDKSAGGFAIARFVYDARSHDLEDRYFDRNDKPMMLPQGYSIVRRTFNANDDETETRYFDQLDRPVDKGGIHRIVWTYDSAGKVLETHDFDITGNEVNADSLNQDNASVEDAAGAVTGPTSVLKSTEGAYAFEFDNRLWSQSKEQLAETADFALLHTLVSRSD